MTKLVGKTALVTGASQGIGASIAKALAAAGAQVAVADLNKAGAETVARTIATAGGEAIAVEVDVTKADQVEALFDTVASEFGRLDILVNNAGIYDILPFDQVTEDLYRRTFDVNVLGVLLTTQAALKVMGEGGSIINTSSKITRRAPKHSVLYTASKLAVEGITRVLANELGPRRIRANAIAPGFVVTEGVYAKGFMGSDFEEYAKAQTPLGRLGQPEDIADVVVFLASDSSRWLTGEVLFVSGGLF
jgi:3-oxoacyl-[acyl-carrier protein] reductase